jgi:hypothetical protein
VPGPIGDVSRFGGDDGSADPAVAAALAAFSSGQGSEHDAVMSLARSRLLVPIVAAVASAPVEQQNVGELPHQAAASPQQAAASPQQAAAQPAVSGGEKASEMSIPTLIGLDGRPAVPAFTCLDTLRRWRQEARPVPTAASDVWAAAVADGSAVVVDVAGPVPLAIDGARLAALADGGPVPPPQEDPDVLAAVRAAAAGLAGIAGFSLADGAAGSDLLVWLRVTAGLPPAAAEQLAGMLAELVMARLGGRLRRGISVAVDVAAPTDPGRPAACSAPTAGPAAPATGSAAPATGRQHPRGQD